MAILHATSDDADTLLENKMVVWGSYIYPPLFDRFTAARLGCPQRAGPIQNLRQYTWAVRSEMDDNEKSRGKIPGQVPDEFGQCLNCTRRRADRDDVVLRHKASPGKIEAIQSAALDTERLLPALNAFDQSSCFPQEGGRVPQELARSHAQLLRAQSKSVASAAKRSSRRR
jgi:hypothetical protein